MANMDTEGDKKRKAEVDASPPFLQEPGDWRSELRNIFREETSKLEQRISRTEGTLSEHEVQLARHDGELAELRTEVQALNSSVVSSTRLPSDTSDPGSSISISGARSLRPRW